MRPRHASNLLLWHSGVRRSNISLLKPPSGGTRHSCFRGRFGFSTCAVARMGGTKRATMLHRRQ